MKQVLVITSGVQPTGDPYSPSAWPGPGAYLYTERVYFVGSTVTGIDRAVLPPFANVAPPTPPIPPGVSEAGLIKIIALCLDRNDGMILPPSYPQPPF